MRSFLLTVVILILSACAPDIAPTNDSDDKVLSVILEHGDVYSGEMRSLSSRMWALVAIALSRSGT